MKNLRILPLILLILTLTINISCNKSNKPIENEDNTKETIATHDMEEHQEVAKIPVDENLLIDTATKPPEPTKDTYGPKIIDTVPGYKEIDIPINITISATFNEPLIGELVNSDTIKLFNQSGKEIPSIVGYRNQVVTLEPEKDLEIGKLYSVMIKKEIEDVEGNSMEEDKSWTFNTGTGVSEDSPNIAKIGFVPQSDPTKVDCQIKSIHVVFDKSMSMDEIDGKDFAIYNKKDPEIKIPLDVAPNSLVSAYIVPMRDFEASSIYELEVMDSVEDIFGNRMKEPYIFEFHTGSCSSNPYTIIQTKKPAPKEEGSEKFAPEIIKINPNDGAMDVPTDKAITITFNKPMSSKGLESSFELYDITNDSKLAFRATPSIDGFMIAINPLQNFMTRSEHKLIISKLLKDLSNTGLKEGMQIEFTTGVGPANMIAILKDSPSSKTIKTSNPKVIQIEPVKTENRDMGIFVRFDKPMDESSLKQSTIVTDNEKTPISVDVTGIDSYTALITPKDTDSVEYIITITPLAKDISGQSLTTPFHAKILFEEMSEDDDE